MIAAVLDLQEGARVFAVGGEGVEEMRGGFVEGKNVGDEGFG